MAHRIIDLHIRKDQTTQLDELVKDSAILDSWRVEEGKDRLSYSLLVRTGETQHVIDKIQTFLGLEKQEDLVGVDAKGSDIRVVVYQVEAVLPMPADEKKTIDKKRNSGVISREELYNDISKGAALDQTFILLAFLSIIVAAIGLLENNVAVIIGAMVIAPFLGPNLALALSTALGDRDLMGKALKTNLVGFSMTFLLAYLLGKFWPYSLDNHEIMSRTTVGFDGIVLAIASGAAAVLSLVTGLSSVLVGVMVAVALLPPATVMGVMFGAGHTDLAMGAAMLLAVNIVCVNLSAKLVFWLKGIRPRTGSDQERARASMKWYLIFWGMTLLILALIILLAKQ